MILSRCNNGYFYDKEKFEKCPYCNAEKVEQHDISLPRELNLFYVVEQLGVGGTGNVFRIRQKSDYAVKIIEWKHQKAREQARHEYEIAKQFEESEHIIKHYGIYEKEQKSYVILECAISWDKYAACYKVSTEFVLRIMKDICCAVSEMHRKGLGHFDINPKNIFVSDFVNGKLGDFSHSMRVNTSKVHNKNVGTYAFMAPEIYTGKHQSGREDIYSLGISMYMMLTGGKQPYDLSGREPAVRQEQDPIQAENISPELLKIVKKATEYQWENRYVSVDEMYEDIVAFLSNHENVNEEEIETSAHEWEHYESEVRMEFLLMIGKVMMLAMCHIIKQMITVQP